MSSFLFSDIWFDIMITMSAWRSFTHVAGRRPQLALAHFHTRPPLASNNPVSKLNGTRRGGRKIPLAIGGTGLVIMGLVCTARGRDDVSDDPRDQRALSVVPLTKLLSGYMCVPPFHD